RSILADHRFPITLTQRVVRVSFSYNIACTCGLENHALSARHGLKESFWADGEPIIVRSARSEELSDRAILRLRSGRDRVKWKDLLLNKKTLFSLLPMAS